MALENSAKVQYPIFPTLDGRHEIKHLVLCRDPRGCRCFDGGVNLTVSSTALIFEYGDAASYIGITRRGLSRFFEMESIDKFKCFRVFKDLKLSALVTQMDESMFGRTYFGRHIPHRRSEFINCRFIVRNLAPSG